MTSSMSSTHLLSRLHLRSYACRTSYSGVAAAAAFRSTRSPFTTTITPPVAASFATYVRSSRPSLIHRRNIDFRNSTTPRPRSISSATTNSNTMAPLFGDDTPDSIKNAQGLHLVTQSTPNGQKVQILLEELKQIYGTEWTTTLINIGTNEQKKDWFLRLDPNGRIPILVDNSISPSFTVHETSAELLYLEKKYDADNAFGFKDDLERNEALQWLFFWHGSGAPYQGQVHHFTRAAPEKLPYAIQRFRNETLRVYGVLEIRLSGKYTGEPREYLAGKGKGKYSVADIGTWPWVKMYSFSGFTDEEMAPFPHLKKWVERIAERPAVKIGTGEKYSKDSTDASVTKHKLE